MGLRDLQIPQSPVKVADEEFLVRGLSPNDALGLYYRHAGELSALFEEFRGVVGAGVEIQPAHLAAVAISSAPRIMAEIIAIASGSDFASPETWVADISVAMSLSAGVQADALEKIGSLTFTPEMPLPKLVGLVRAMARSAQATSQKAPGASPSGSGESGPR